jgi:truncated hemoglobin YjbI
MNSSTKTLYERLGGYDAISAVANDLLSRLETDPQLGRFWAHRDEDGVAREKQLLWRTAVQGPTSDMGNCQLARAKSPLKMTINTSGAT